MTTKTGEALRGRKRPKSVLAKAWETRRLNEAKALREAKRGKTGSSKPSARAPMLGSVLLKLTPARGAKKLTRPTKKPASKPRSDPPMTASNTMHGGITGGINPYAGDRATGSEMAMVSRHETFAQGAMEIARSHKIPPAERSRQIENMFRTTFTNAYNDGETDQRRLGDESQRVRQVCETLQDYELYKRISNRYAPFLISGSAMEAIVQVLHIAGFTPLGKKS